MTSSVSGQKRKLSFFREVKDELKKVSWTSKEELFFCTKVVILATVFFGLAIYGVDLTIHAALDGVAATLRMIFG